MVKYLDYSGLSYFWGKLKDYFVAQETGKGLSTNDFTDAYKAMLDTVDSTPTADSTNFVTSGGVATALAGKQATLTFDNTPTENSDNPVKSGGIYTALAGKKNTQTAVADPSADGNDIEFISGITQNTQGVITPLKKTVRSASTSQTGVVQLDSATDSAAENKAATPKAVKIAKDAADAAQLTANAAIPATEKGANSGVAPLNASGLIDSQYLPSYVDDVIEAYPVSGKTELASDWLALDAAGTKAITPEAGKIYILMADSTTYGTNSQFRWSGSAYVKMADGGVTSISNSEIDTMMAS